MAMLAVGVVLAVVATAIGGALHGGADFGGFGTELRAYVIIVVLQVPMAAAFGALAAARTVALGAFLAAPVVWAKASEPLLGKAAPWFDIFAAYDHLPRATRSTTGRDAHRRDPVGRRAGGDRRHPLPAPGGEVRRGRVDDAADSAPVNRPGALRRASAQKSANTWGGSGDPIARWVSRIPVRPVDGSVRHDVPVPPSQPKPPRPSSGVAMPSPQPAPSPRNSPFSAICVSVSRLLVSSSTTAG